MLFLAVLQVTMQLERENEASPLKQSPRSREGVNAVVRWQQPSVQPRHEQLALSSDVRKRRLNFGVLRGRAEELDDCA